MAALVQEQKLRAAIQKDLKELDPSLFALKWIFETIPKIFSDVNVFQNWKTSLASRLNVDPFSLVIVGSACTGISLHPEKEYRAFRPSGSDLDIACVSSYHFEVSWRALRELGTTKYKMSYEAQREIERHRDSYVYWGTIATDLILEYLPFGKEWTKVLSDVHRTLEIPVSSVKVRIYRDSYSLLNYHVNNLRHLKRELLTPITKVRI